MHNSDSTWRPPPRPAPPYRVAPIERSTSVSFATGETPQRHQQMDPAMGSRSGNAVGSQPRHHHQPSSSSPSPPPQHSVSPASQVEQQFGTGHQAVGIIKKLMKQQRRQQQKRTEVAALDASASGNARHSGAVARVPHTSITPSPTRMESPKPGVERARSSSPLERLDSGSRLRQQPSLAKRLYQPPSLPLSTPAPPPSPARVSDPARDLAGKYACWPSADPNAMRQPQFVVPHSSITRRKQEQKEEEKQQRVQRAHFAAMSRHSTTIQMWLRWQVSQRVVDAFRPCLRRVAESHARHLRGQQPRATCTTGGVHDHLESIDHGTLRGYLRAMRSVERHGVAAVEHATCVQRFLRARASERARNVHAEERARFFVHVLQEL